MNKSMIIREIGGYTRIGDKDWLTVYSYKKNITKRTILPTQNIVKIYNERDELIAIETSEGKEQKSKVITDLRKGTTVVILYREGKKFKGSAKCHEDDVFNVQTGYEIAKSKAIIKCHMWKIGQYTKSQNCNFKKI